MFKPILFVLIMLSALGGAFAQNTWTQLNDFPNIGRGDGFSFVLDTNGDGQADKGYMGGGWDPSIGTASNTHDFWEYDFATDVWTQKADFLGQATRSQCAFVLDNIAYVAGGAYGGSSLSKQMWAYNFNTDTWTRKNDAPGLARWSPSAFVLNGKAYYGLGSSSGSLANPSHRSDFYEYNPTLDTWTAVADFPGPGRILPFTLALDTDMDNVADKGYIGAGANGASNKRNDVWEYNQVNNTWTQRANFPGAARSLTSHFSIGSLGFVGMGYDYTTHFVDFYQYNHSTDTWTRMSDFTGGGIKGTFNFVFNNTAYLASGSLPQNSSSAVYKYEPLLNGYSEIKGNIFADGNANCTMDGTEFVLENIAVQAMPGQYLTSTDAAGNYVFRVPVGTFTVSPIIPSHLSTIFPSVDCPSGGNITLTIDTIDIDTSGNDFGITALQCPQLSVQVASGGRLRCFINQTMISYCNYGLADEANVYIVLTLPDFISIDTANHVFTSLGNDEYRFEIGNLAAGACGEIRLIDYVSCADINLLGAAACTEVRIYPANGCIPQDTLAWNGANVEIEAVCLEGGDTVHITLTNTGTADMVDSSELRILFDGAVGYTENFWLAQGETYTLFVASNGMTIIAQADQVAGHPYTTEVVAWMERCRTDSLTEPLFTIIPDFPLGDEYEQYDVECLAVSGSYDPNDKQAQPSGVGPSNIIPPGTTINYKLRFQNTGTATAQNVYLVDTLDGSLDLATLRVNAASHAYRMEVSGQGQQTIVTFYFDNIMLPDSSADQLGSNGFVSFSIKPKATAALGTMIENFCDIYFDFNPPVRTNTVPLTVDNLPVDLVAIKDGNTIIYLDAPSIAGGKQQLQFFPNPANSSINILATFPANGEAEVLVTDLVGRTVIKERFQGVAGSNELFSLDVSGLNAGVYIVVINRQGELSTGKLIKE